MVFFIIQTVEDGRVCIHPSSSPKYLFRNVIGGIFWSSTHRVYRLEIANFFCTFSHVCILDPAMWSVLSPVAQLLFSLVHHFSSLFQILYLLHTGSNEKKIKAQVYVKRRIKWYSKIILSYSPNLFNFFPFKIITEFLMLLAYSLFLRLYAETY